MPSMSDAKRILYCRCAYAKVVPLETKDEVLRQLSDSGEAFDAVPDLCEMSARQDPSLEQLAEGGNLKIAACYPRAVRWLFAAGGAKLADEGVEVLNMRTESPEDVCSRILGDGVADSPSD